MPSWRMQVLDVAPLADQSGTPTVYFTEAGTACTYRAVYPGGTQDHYHYLLLFMPDSLNRGIATPMVGYLHGATATERQVFTNAGASGMLDSWLDAGWSVIVWRLGTTVNPDGSDENDGKWGNTLMRAAFADTYAWIGQNFVLPAQGLCLYGVSAGGTNGMNAVMEAATQSFAVAAFAMIDPAVNLRWCYDKNYESAIPHTQSGASSAIRSQIIAAYGLSTNGGTGGGRPYAGTPADAEWTAKVDTPDDGHDPCQVDLAYVPDIPIYLLASASDALISKAKNADVLFGRLDPSWTSELTYEVVGGTHGADSHFDPGAQNAFFGRALGL